MRKTKTKTKTKTNRNRNRNRKTKILRKNYNVRNKNRAGMLSDDPQVVSMVEAKEHESRDAMLSARAILNNITIVILQGVREGDKYLNDQIQELQDNYMLLTYEDKQEFIDYFAYYFNTNFREYPYDMKKYYHRIIAKIHDYEPKGHENYTLLAKIRDTATIIKNKVF